MIQQYLSPQDAEIEAALQMHCAALKSGFWEVVAAVVLFLKAIVQLTHALLRIIWAGFGLALWSAALLLRVLSWCYEQAAARSSDALKGR